MSKEKHVYFDFNDGRKPPVAIRDYSNHRQLARFCGDGHKVTGHCKSF